jgi:hypothetical protein
MLPLAVMETRHQWYSPFMQRSDGRAEDHSSYLWGRGGRHGEHLHAEDHSRGNPPSLLASCRPAEKLMQQSKFAADGFQKQSKRAAEELQKVGQNAANLFGTVMGAKLGGASAGRRYADLKPDWTDLMMWAVLTGEDSIARMLWHKTTSPIRAAIIASRLLHKIAKDLDDDGVQANLHALEYEDWACGVLNLIEKDAAMQLLTMVPQKGPHKMWEKSVMDEACDQDLPCRFFVATPNCQELLERYYHGEYVGSKAMILPTTTTVALAIQARANSYGWFPNKTPRRPDGT